MAIQVFILVSQNAWANKNPVKNIPQILIELENELIGIQEKYETSQNILFLKLNVINTELRKDKNPNDKINLILKKDDIEDEIKFNKLLEQNEISKIRFLKGLQIIKILYEKTLSLDHHFASVATFNEISNLSNPNQYPEFLELKNNIQLKQDKKTGFALTDILGNNIYTSVIHSFASLLSNPDSSKKEKEASMKEVECILDFTLRMHNDLNTIYFETAFLQKSNQNIMVELENLFEDYTKPIKYLVSLKECRNNDDWETVRENLNEYLNVIDKYTNDESQQYKLRKMLINLEFSIDRLLQFISMYNNHIDQGAKFYEKFGIMLNSYENEKQCTTKIPVEYQKLKDNVQISIEKFNTAYKPIEINGSKMKQILYGINEYD
jgi:hypothetical protein